MKNPDPTGDEFLAKTMLWIAAVLLVLLLLGLLGCANIDRNLWNLLQCLIGRDIG